MGEREGLWDKRSCSKAPNSINLCYSHSGQGPNNDFYLSLATDALNGGRTKDILPRFVFYTCTDLKELLLLLQIIFLSSSIIAKPFKSFSLLCDYILVLRCRTVKWEEIFRKEIRTINEVLIYCWCRLFVVVPHSKSFLSNNFFYPSKACCSCENYIDMAIKFHK